MCLGFTSHRTWDKETPSLHFFFFSFCIWMGNFTKRICLLMPFSPNAILPLGVSLKLIHCDSRKTEKLLRSHQQHPVTPEHTCVFDVIKMYFVRVSVTHLLYLCETSFQIHRRHEVSNLPEHGKGHCRKKQNIYQEHFLSYFKLCLQAFKEQFWYAKILTSFKVQIDTCEPSQTGLRAYLYLWVMTG